MLFKSTTQLKEYATVSGNGDFNGYKASLRVVENKFIIPILGDEQYKELNEAVNSGEGEDQFSDQEKNLLEKCRMAIGPLFCYVHADKTDISFTESGIRRAETDGLKTAYQYQKNDFKTANLAEGEDALELLLQFLEEHKEEYESWTSSKSFEKYRSLFIKSGFEFNEFFPSATPYRNYWAMRTKMLDIEENTIRPFLGDAIFDELKEIDANVLSNFTDLEYKLLFKIKKAIANLTVAYAAPLLNVQIIGNDLTIHAATSFTTNDNDNKRAGIIDNALSIFIKSCESAGRDWLNNADKFLNDNKTHFQNWPGLAANDADDDCCNDGTGGAFGMC